MYRLRNIEAEPVSILCSMFSPLEGCAVAANTSNEAEGLLTKISKMKHLSIMWLSENTNVRRSESWSIESRRHHHRRLIWLYSENWNSCWRNSFQPWRREEISGLETVEVSIPILHYGTTEERKAGSCAASWAVLQLISAGLFSQPGSSQPSAGSYFSSWRAVAGYCDSGPIMTSVALQPSYLQLASVQLKCLHTFNPSGKWLEIIQSVRRVCQESNERERRRERKLRNIEARREEERSSFNLW